VPGLFEVQRANIGKASLHSLSFRRCFLISQLPNLRAGQTIDHREESKNALFLHTLLTPPENNGRQKDHEAEGT
jgi:hypothetical protein